MKRSIIVLVCMLLAAMWTGIQAQDIAIVPKPTELKVTGNGYFALDSSIIIVVLEDELLKPAAIFAQVMEPVLGCKLQYKTGKKAKNAITLSLNNSLQEEQYTLSATKKGVSIQGGSPRAVLHGLQSLRQIVSDKGIPMVEISDNPFFAYRGMMLDACRHFRTVDEVKRFIDILSLHKINKFHWHLTDDQGWRIAIRKYPLLTQVGSVRSETLIGKYSPNGKYDGKPYGGFYTQNDIREVVRYASERYIDVIPEIEMPGHACAALASYPYLGCKGEGYKVATTWGIFDDVFCAGKDSTFDFMEGVLAEVIELFPYKYIHIGGDECPKGNWEVCQHCQQRITDNGLKDEHELQGYFMKRIEKWANGHGRSIIGWDEILEGGISSSATVMSWRSNEGGVQAAKHGNNAIMAPTEYCYLNYYQAPPENEPLAIGGFVPVEKVYSLDPYAGLGEQEKPFILGAQGNTWAEYLPLMTQVEYMVLPRMAALSEVCWAYDRKDYADFLRRMQSFRNVYDVCGYNYGRHIFVETK